MNGSEKLLTFEITRDQTVEIHANPEGLALLIDVLQGLLQRGGSDHEHLRTPAWAGVELTEEVQGEGDLVNHVRVCLWDQGSQGSPG